jgi:hypothetical protein
MLDPKRHPHFNKVMYMNLMFTILYTPFFCVQNLASTLQKEGGFGDLGFTVLAVLYGVTMIGAIIAPAVVTKMGLRAGMVVGGLFTSMVVFCQVIPAFRVANQNENPADHSAFW